MLNKWLSGLFVVGAVMVLVGAATYITGWLLSPYIYAVGSVLAAMGQCFVPSASSGVRLRRLYRQQKLGAMFLVLTGVLMFTTHGNEWIASLTIAAVLELYTAFHIPREEARERERRDE